jgi:hypothetical protein
MMSIFDIDRVQTQKSQPLSRLAFSKKSWRRPTFPQGCPCSIIGAERLNFRVRNGNGCFPLASTTTKRLGSWMCHRFYSALPINGFALPGIHPENYMECEISIFELRVHVKIEPELTLFFRTTSFFRTTLSKNQSSQVLDRLVSLSCTC